MSAFPPSRRRSRAAPTVAMLLLALAFSAGDATAGPSSDLPVLQISPPETDAKRPLPSPSVAREGEERGGAVLHLANRVDANHRLIQKNAAEIARLNAEIATLNAELQRALEDLRLGLFCSECKRSRTQIER